MMTLLRHIEEQLQKTLPGIDAQYAMAHATRSKRPTRVPKDARKAGVMALFYEKMNLPHLVLIERKASNPNDKHGGQIGFPGGKYEEEDASMAHTARRETEEEIGVPQEEIHLLGNLTPLYIPVSNFEVFPFVGYVEKAPIFMPQEEEVASILEVPLETLQQHQARKEKDLRIHEHITLKRVPYFAVQGHTVWGATAMMLNELLTVIE